MKVFKACLSITRRRPINLFVYFIVFTVISVLSAQFMGNQTQPDFSVEKPHYSIINRDEDSSLLKGLSQFMEQHGSYVSLEDNKEALQDACFFHASDYIMIVPKGFTKKLTTASPLKLETVTVPNSAKGYYLGGLATQYLHMYQNYAKFFPELTKEELTDAVLHALEKEGDAQKVQFSTHQPLPIFLQSCTRLYAYTAMILIIMSLTTVLMIFRRPDLNLRNVASPLKPLSKSLQISLFGLCISFLVFLVLAITSILFCIKDLRDVDGRILGLLALNMLVYALVSLSIALMISHFVENWNLQSAVANLLSLGLAFLGGAFVPLELLGDSMKQVSKLTPTYWYVSACDAINSFNTFSAQNLAFIRRAILIQLICAAAFFFISLAVSRAQNQREQPLGSIRTEYQ